MDKISMTNKNKTNGIPERSIQRVKHTLARLASPESENP
jgi:hypothetical protein